MLHIQGFGVSKIKDLYVNPYDITPIGAKISQPNYYNTSNANRFKPVFLNIDQNDNDIVLTDYLEDASNHIFLRYFDEEIVDVNGTDTVFVKIPKFYIKMILVNSTNNNNSYQCSTSYIYSVKKLDDTYILHPAFLRYGKELDYIYIQSGDWYHDGNLSFNESKQKISDELPSNFEMINAHVWGACQHIYLLISMVTINNNGFMSSGANAPNGYFLYTNSSGQAGIFYGNYTGVTTGPGRYIDGIKLNASKHIQLWDEYGNREWQDTGVTQSGTTGQFVYRFRHFSYKINPESYTVCSNNTFIPVDFGTSNTMFSNIRGFTAVANAIYNIRGIYEYQYMITPDTKSDCYIKLVYYPD